MGLGLKKHVAAFVSKWTGSIATLLCLASFGMMLLLPVTFTRGTYFSENSLMIGGTVTPWNAADTEWVERNAERVFSEPNDEKWRESVVSAFAAEEADPWVQRWVSDDGEPGETVIARVQAHRGTSGSSVLLVCNRHDPMTVALFARSAAILSQAAYLGLDVHFVVVAAPSNKASSFRNGVAAFARLLNAAPHLSPGLNSGAVRAALVFDFQRGGYGFDYVHLRTLSKDSFQPNMDLANSVHRLCGNACAMLPKPRGPPHSALAAAAAVVLGPLRSALWNVRAGDPAQLAANVANFWGYLREALVGAGAVHTPLRALGVHSVTLEGVADPVGGGGGGPAKARGNARTLAVVLFGFARGMNNLCERLHQSFWIYHYVNDQQFVDFDSAQPVAWVAAGSIILSTFRAGPSSRGLLPPLASLVLFLPGVLAVGCLLVSNVSHSTLFAVATPASIVLWPAVVLSSKSDAARRVHRAALVAAGCCLVAATVLCNALSIVLGPYLAAAAVAFHPGLLRATPLRRIVSFALFALLFCPVYLCMAGAPPLSLTPLVAYYLAVLPLSGASLAFAVAPAPQLDKEKVS
ncbi:hypothetical protein DIPPA_19935 [Diplonema papillatum]|nr:hypothetical protein DIPPA_19935 [Diplonema papillatum]